MLNMPELLCPAGSLEKLKTAILYGADAVYLGGQSYGLRQAADNFTENELKAGVDFCHQYGAKAYVVLNSFLLDEDFAGIDHFLTLLEQACVDAVIVSDLGIIERIRRLTSLDIHISTQASTLNSQAVKLYQDFGAKRIILGREVSLRDAEAIKESTGVELEMFVHGSMCMAYSGHCVISNFTQGRDSNRGGCAHSCRFEYNIKLSDEENLNAFFMSSKDLNGLALIPQYVKAGIDSIKVEGRMKGPLYCATVSKVYREALDYYQQHQRFDLDSLVYWEEELKKFSHRDYTTAALDNSIDKSSIFNDRESSLSQEYEVAAIVNSRCKNSAVIEVKNSFTDRDILEVIPFKGRPYDIGDLKLCDLQNNQLKKTKPSTLVRINLADELQENTLIRLRK